MEEALDQVRLIFCDSGVPRPVGTVLSVGPPPAKDKYSPKDWFINAFIKYPFQELTDGLQNYVAAMKRQSNFTTLFERVCPNSDEAKEIAMDSIDIPKMKDIMNKEFLNSNLEYFDKVIEAAAVIWSRIVTELENSELASYLAHKIKNNANNCHVYNNRHLSNVRKAMERPFMKPLYFAKMLEMKRILADTSRAIKTIWEQFDMDGFQRFGAPIILCFIHGSLIVHFQITISTKDLDFFDTP